MCGMFTQGVALGYVVLPLRGVPLTTFDTPSYVLLPLRGVLLASFDTYVLLGFLTLASGKAERRQVHPLKLPACPHQQLRLALVYELDDEFAEERVLP